MLHSLVDSANSFKHVWQLADIHFYEIFYRNAAKNTYLCNSQYVLAQQSSALACPHAARLSERLCSNIPIANN